MLVRLALSTVLATGITVLPGQNRALYNQLERATCNRDWKSAISIVDSLLRVTISPKTRPELKRYRAALIESQKTGKPFKLAKCNTFESVIRRYPFLMLLPVIGGVWAAIWYAGGSGVKRSRHTGGSEARRLRYKLYQMLNGDGVLAERLIQGMQETYPDQSVAWCIDKVIYGLKRDRR